MSARTAVDRIGRGKERRVCGPSKPSWALAPLRAWRRPTRPTFAPLRSCKRRRPRISGTLMWHWMRSGWGRCMPRRRRRSNDRFGTASTSRGSARCPDAPTSAVCRYRRTRSRGIGTRPCAGSARRRISLRRSSTAWRAGWACLRGRRIVMATPSISPTLRRSRRSTAICAIGPQRRMTVSRDGPTFARLGKSCGASRRRTGLSGEVVARLSTNYKELARLERSQSAQKFTKLQNAGTASGLLALAEERLARADETTQPHLRHARRNAAVAIPIGIILPARPEDVRYGKSRRKPRSTIRSSPF
jgi:hypothetical protein